MARGEGPRQVAFWFAVAGVSLISPTLLNIAADKAGDKAPALRQFNNYLTRNGG